MQIQKSNQGYKQTEIGEVPVDWQIVSLKEAAQAGADTFVDGPFGSDLKVSDYTNSGIMLIQLQNVGDGIFYFVAIITDPLEIRLKDENQLFEELNKVAQEVLKEYPHIGTSIEEVSMKSLFMWHGCLNIDKQCRLKDVHGIEPENRLAVHDFLVGQSSSNPWIRKGFCSARLFRQTPDQTQPEKDYNWIPSDSPYWK